MSANKCVNIDVEFARTHQKGTSAVFNYILLFRRPSDITLVNKEAAH